MTGDGHGAEMQEEPQAQEDLGHKQESQEHPQANDVN